MRKNTNVEDLDGIKITKYVCETQISLTTPCKTSPVRIGLNIVKAVEQRLVIQISLAVLVLDFWSPNKTLWKNPVRPKTVQTSVV